MSLVSSRFDKTNLVSIGFVKKRKGFSFFFVASLLFKCISSLLLRIKFTHDQLHKILRHS